MDPLAFLEVVDRHNDVLARHPIYRWPAKIGRSYGSDVILDDAFVAPLHLEIEPAAEGRFTVSDLGSLNGAYFAASDQRLAREEIGPDDVVRVGHTQIRIRTPSYSVPRERRLRATALYRRPAVFVAMAALTMALSVWNAWIMVSDDENRYMLMFITLGVLIFMGAWIAGWSFVSSAVGRQSNFAAHGVIACIGVVAMSVSESFLEYLSFGFDAAWMQHMGVVLTAVILAYMVYRHLLLNSRATRRNLSLAATGVAAGLYALGFGLDLALDVAQQGKQRYNESIKAPVFLFATGTPFAAFMSDAEALKLKVDAASRK